ncbi:MAG: ComEC/Rec2 family competence protein [Clostridia bacterium]|nr:ComEC/Rec2 family competence protein [Clostridia bacterium]
MEQIALKRPMLFVSLSFVISIIVFCYFGFSLFLISVVLDFILAFILSRNILKTVITGVILLALVAGISDVQNNIDTAVSQSGKYHTYDMVVCSETTKSKSSFVNVKIYNDKYIKDGTKFNLYFKNESVECGERITADVLFFEIKDNKYYKASLSKEAYGSLWLKDIKKRNGYNNFYYKIGRYRQGIKWHIRSYLSPKTSATLIAVMLGDKSYLAGNFSNNVRRSGVSHIMAVSGLHLSVIMLALFFVFDKLVRNKYLRFIAVCLSVFALTALCGFTPSIIRAGVMMIVFSVPPLFSRDCDKISGLCVTFCIILISAPMLLFNLSFQMSMAAVVAVLIVSPTYIEAIKGIIPEKLSFINIIIDIVVISVLAQLFTMPFSIYNFKSVSFISPLTNILISFAVTLVLQIAFFSLVLKFIPILSGYLMFLCEIGLRYINFIINRLGNLKYAAISVPKSCFLLPIIPIVVLIILIKPIKRRSLNDGKQ